MDDVKRLAQSPTPASRVSTAAKLAQQFNAAEFSPAEMKLAEEIFRVMTRDAEVRVREALSANLKANPNLPHDVAVALAKDVDSVALPVLTMSEVLTAADLVQIVRSQGSPQRLDAIAGRRHVEESVSSAIVDVGSESVVAKLLGNPGAEFAEPTLHKVVDKFGDNEAIQGPLVHRNVLPVTVAERLVTRVADHFRAHLLASHKVSSDVALDLILQSRERATAGLAMGVDDAGLVALVDQLKDNHRLTGSLVLRTICMGNLRFFEFALAALTGIPVMNARILIHDPGRRGLATIWTRAGLPAATLPAVQAAIDVVEKTGFDGLALDPERYARRIIERVLTQYEKLGGEFAADDIEYLLARLNQLPPAAVAVH